MRDRDPRHPDDSLLRAIIGLAVGLAVLFGILFLLWGRGQVIAVLTWYSPMMNSFMALAGLSIAFLSFGRYRVLREPAPFWIGIAFTGFTIFAVFYVLSLPGLLPSGRGLIAGLTNTASWFWHLQFSALVLSLLAALFVSWPAAGATGERWSLRLVVAAGAILVLIAWLLTIYEQSLPLLVVDGAWTPLNVSWDSVLVFGFAAGTVLSARRYRQTGDSLFGYVAIAQLILAFAILTVIIGLQFYDQWWYFQRVLWIAAFSVMLFGQLSEYVALYRRERARTRELEALQRVTDPATGREGMEQLLRSLLEQMVDILDANAGAIFLLDQARDELVLRNSEGIPKELAADFRVKVGEDFSGRVAARNAVFWVRDAQADPAIWSPYIRERHVRGMLGAPMRASGELIGIVQVDFLEVREFTAQEERLLEVLAERAALAIQQARLLEDAQRERNRLQVLIDTTPVGIILYSAPEGPRPVLFNRAAEAILGRPLLPEAGIAEVAAHYGICRPTGEPFPPEELPLSRSLRGETCTGVEMLIRQPSGRGVHILTNSTPLRDAEGRIVGAVLAFQDITAIKEQERLRDEFISAAAHELKTPVTTIKGYAQLMGQWAPQGHEPREGKAIQAINAQADRISRRVQEMLEVVRLRAAPPELRRVRFDLGELAGEVVQRVQVTTEVHRLVLERKAPAPVDADRERIEEVLVSLVDNAIKYSPKGGEIQVRVWAQEGEAMVSVMD
ncbi:MAG: GAF domain-containing protein, partial [Bacteroidetes bacterium]|nr:GAF domain-containing protein [Bacteroidota bacterium]